ncbi:hypothetical protein KSX_72160 [Ktedonospora formicarum]|uniref:Anaphase-promoting complex subunit 4 WD40 domain-containing protein n=1 Tax=Ktedonospora formicarum TaxID=2778364 RepID=A0A8J3IB35_9CHLR|nr:hypothetical protein KSX_72160 [Ktedonospora formicarum]
MSWSPDGKKITAVVSDLSPHIETWDATTGRILWQKAYQHNEPEPVEIAWSPNGKLLAVNTGTQTVSSNWGVSIFDGGTRHLLAFNGKLSKFPNGTTIAWSPDSTTIAATSESVSLWNVNRGMTTTVAPAIAQRQDVVSWSHDGSALVFGSHGVFRVVDVTTTATRCTATYAPGDRNPMGSLAWSTNDQSIFTESVDLIMIFNASNCTTERISTYNNAGTTLSATVVQCSPDVKWIAFLSKEPTVRVYDVAKGIFAWHFVNPTQKTVVNVSWSPNSHLLASIDVGGTIMIWELR